MGCRGGVNELFYDLCHPTGLPQGDRPRQTGRQGDNKPTVAVCRWTSWMNTIGGLISINISSNKTLASISNHPLKPNLTLTTVLFFMHVRPKHTVSALDMDDLFVMYKAVRVNMFMHRMKCVY